MKFKLLIEEITTAAFAGWSENPSGNGFDMPLEAALRIKKMNKGLFLGPNRRKYSKIIGTVPDYYNKQLKKIFL